jgi:glycosyltransferase involved in cell wall biosynthesis
MPPMTSMPECLPRSQEHPDKGPARRITHVVGEAVRGGCETNCAVVIRNSPGVQHRVIVLGSPGPMSSVWEGLGARVEHLDCLRLGWLAFGRKIRDALAGGDPDGAILWAGIRVPLVLLQLSCPAVVYAGNPFGRSWRLRAFFLGASIARRPRGPVTLFACSEHVARSCRQAPYFRRLPLRVCLNPVEIPRENRHTPRELDPSRPARIGMVARLDPIKDHATVLKAVAQILNIWPMLRLGLAGDGVLRAELEAQAATLGISGSVDFLGSIGDVGEFLDSLDVFVYSTTSAEGMGSALAEALARGLPCVVSDLPVMREVVGESEAAARTVPPGRPDDLAQAIEQLLSGCSERRELSKRAFDRAVRVFDARRITGAYMEALGAVP